MNKGENMSNRNYTVVLELPNQDWVDLHNNFTIEEGEEYCENYQPRNSNELYVHLLDNNTGDSVYQRGLV